MDFIFSENNLQGYKYVQSKNGKYLLIYEGFSYRKYMTYRSRQSYWLCTFKGCKAKATMSPEGWFSLSKNNHTHGPDFEEMERKVLMSELRKLTLETEMTPDELLKHVGISEDPHKKFREAIGFWRWRAKRKCEMESPAYNGDQIKELDVSEYKFVKIGQYHLLQYRNYLYKKYMSSKINSGSFWRCRREDCPARIKLDAAAVLSCISFNHNHPEEEFKGEAVEKDLKQMVRDMALATDLTVAEILKIHNSEEDVELRKYIKNIRCRKYRTLRGKKRKTDPPIINQIEQLENVPPGVFVKISKDLLCEISELPVNQGEEVECQQGTLVKLDDQSMVQVINFDPESDTLGGELLFKGGSEKEFQISEESVQIAEEGGEVMYETINVGDYTTFVITSDKEGEIQPGLVEQVQIEEMPINYEEIAMAEVLPEK